MSSEKLIISPKLPRGEDGYKTFSIRIRDETVIEIDEIAAATRRSRNELIGILLKYALEHYEIVLEE
ncbi:MAG: ribbon-helix-helix domain-containing protein [Oscillospiraceae bacterium]|nr:ribbon-helix-helix domain-containing protein [Oscillospiraceae bacterium]